jgi:hypothetical protein
LWNRSTYWNSLDLYSVLSVLEYNYLHSWFGAGLPDGIFSNHKSFITNLPEGLLMEDVGLFMVIWSILQPFSIFCGYLCFSSWGILYQEKSGNPGLEYIYYIFRILFNNMNLQISKTIDSQFHMRLVSQSIFVNISKYEFGNVDVIYFCKVINEHVYCKIYDD